MVCAGIALGCSSSDDKPANVDFDTGLGSETSFDSGGGVDSHVADSTNDTSDSSVVVDSSADSGDTHATDARDAIVVDSVGETPPDAGPPVCSPTKDWTTVTDSALAGLSTTGSDDVLGGVTPDELTIVWTTFSAPTVTVKFADRSDTASAFGAPQSITSPIGFTKVTISADGLRMIATDSTRKNLVQLSRAARGDAFGAPDSTGFGEIDALTGDGTTVLADPTLAPDGLHLIVATSGLAIATTLYESTWTGTEWGAPAAVAGPWSTGSTIYRPSAYSTDARTLFLTDAATHDGSFAFRPAIGFAFDTQTSIGAHAFAAPNAGCNKLYFARGVNPDGTDLDLFVTM